MAVNSVEGCAGTVSWIFLVEFSQGRECKVEVFGDMFGNVCAGGGCKGRACGNVLVVVKIEVA